MPTEDGIARSLDAWLEHSVADAQRRGLAELEPLLRGLAASTMALRRADWNAEVPEPPARPSGLPQSRR